MDEAIIMQRVVSRSEISRQTVKLTPFQLSTLNDTIITYKNKTMNHHSTFIIQNTHKYRLLQKKSTVTKRKTSTHLSGTVFCPTNLHLAVEPLTNHWSPLKLSPDS